MIISEHAYPRVGLIGNPSDGYFGKTLAFTFSNFRAEVLLFETPELEIQLNSRDKCRFCDMQSLVADVRMSGYYGGIRLLKATIKRFHDYCREQDIPLSKRNFTIRYTTSIPSQVGLAGSSAIITACLRALMRFYEVSIPRPIQANLILAVEKQELGIAAGLQDRVAQVYGGLVYMDFNRALMEGQGYGHYEVLPPALLPPLYVAYRTELSESSDVFHNDIRGRFERGDRDVVEAMSFWAELTDRVRDLLLQRRAAEIGPLLDASFDRRRQIYRLSPGNIAMVETARAAGASAKFSGSGGAIVGSYDSPVVLRRLRESLQAQRVHVILPDIVTVQEITHDT